MSKIKKKSSKVKKQDYLVEVICLKNCYFGGDFYKGDENYKFKKELAEMAAKTNKFNLV